jgi:hypothetical protein
MKKISFTLILVALCASSSSAQTTGGSPFGIRDHGAFTAGNGSCLVQRPAASPVSNSGFVPIRLPSKVKKEATMRSGGASVQTQIPGAMFGN